ncbi:hypothetical protein VTJ49DRAFT_5755 [Mycothermus thermophilus]|uniref:Peptidyl-prolyl cis-trans isomerase n=1 Tax=Humicola insolens TaxID=85995 RepID=A0ABR3V300_HUMIN
MAKAKDPKKDSKKDSKADEKGGKGKKGKKDNVDAEGGDEGKKNTKLKGAMSINVRHILVRLPFSYSSYLFGSESRGESATTLICLASARMLTVMVNTQCEKFSKSEQAMERLKNGERFDEVAKDMSEDKAKAGGSLGWQTKGNLDPQFEEVAFKLSPSTVSSPTYERVKTQFGYHIIMVEGRK